MGQLIPFSPQVAGIIEQWIVDPAYKAFFRNQALIPSADNCRNYPQYTGNMTMFYGEQVDGGVEIIGMVCLYDCNYRNRTGKASILIDKKFHGQKIGHEVFCKFCDYLFKMLQLRKVVVEIVDRNWIKPLTGVGFKYIGVYSDHSYLNGQLCDEILMECFADEFSGAEAAT